MKVFYFSDMHLDFYQDYLSPRYINIIADQLEISQNDAKLYQMTKTFWFPFSQKEQLYSSDELKNSILVIAGDLWIGTKPFSFMNLSWIELVATKFKKVLIVWGNHDYWNSSLINLTLKANKYLKEKNILNVHILDNSFIEIDNVIYAGTTLWTNMNNGDSLVMSNAPSRMIPDFRYIKNKNYRRFTPITWISEYNAGFNFLSKIATKGKEEHKAVVIITHHAPAIQSIAPQYSDSSDSYYYYTDMSEFIGDNAAIKYWVHGHTHHVVNYNLSGINILSNPVGYLMAEPTGYDLNAHFNI